MNVDYRNTFYMNDNDFYCSDLVDIEPPHGWFNVRFKVLNMYHELLFF